MSIYNPAVTHNMAISVEVPKDLGKIKTKAALNLTKRQLVCFGAAILVGVPFYLLAHKALGTELTAMIMVVMMVPFFFLAMFERDGFPAEKVVHFMVRQKILLPKVRPYSKESERQKKKKLKQLRKEVKRLEAKARKK